MERYKVRKLKSDKDIVVKVPGSKSITNRALLLAAMSKGKCTLKDVLFSDDTRCFIDSLIKLGFDVIVNESESTVTVNGTSGIIPKDNAEIYVGSAGTAARFLTVMLSCCKGKYRVTSSEQMKKRPMKELIVALESLGVKFEFEEEKYHFPFKIISNGITDAETVIDTTISSQFASALLLCAAGRNMKITLTGDRTKGSYILITLKMLKQFGISFENDLNTYTFLEQTYHIEKYDIEPDLSGAAYFYAMGAICNKNVTVIGVTKDTMQGDIKFLCDLERMGAVLSDSDDGFVKLSCNGTLTGIDTDMSDYSDQALTMAVVSMFAKGTTVIRNVGHIRNQECDRINAIEHNLKLLGCDCKVDGDDITINPADTYHGAIIPTFDDHRVSMSFSLAGLKIDDVVIDNPMCCRKTFENYYNILDNLCEK